MALSVVALAAFIELAPGRGDGGLELFGDNLLLVQRGCLQDHVHEVLVNGRIATDGGIGSVIPGLDVLL